MDTNYKGLLELFDKFFSDVKDKRIVIYGLGSLTRLIVDNKREYNFVGLLDNSKKDGQIFGIPVLDERNLELYNIDVIIIVARPSNVKLIYRRIENRCKELMIDVYDVSGNNLGTQKEVLLKEHDYFSRSFDELVRIIDSHDIISFDIFDTLVIRRTLYPTDIFELMKFRVDDLSDNFAYVRMDAERELRLMGEEPSIYDIYDRLYSDGTVMSISKDLLIRAELEQDKELLLIRERMVDALNYCIKRNKSVYLISDMYYSKEIICEIMEEMGIQGYKDVFVSCEYGVSKASGLFEIYKKHVGEGKLLHIGDDEYADGNSAKEYGLESYLIKSARDILELSTYSKLLKHDDMLGNRVIIGMFLAKIFNDPFTICVYKGKGCIKTYFDFAYLFIAPFLVKLVTWLLDKHSDRNIDMLLFAARDGYLIKKIYDYIRVNEEDSKAESVYFYVSRMACVPASIKDDNDIRHAFSLAYDGRPDEMLKDRFFLKDEDILPYNNTEPYSYIMQHKEAIYKVSEKLRNNYLKYIDNLRIDTKSKIAFFDFVSSGTCQISLQRILGLPLEGYYVSVIDNDYNKDDRGRMHSLYENDFTFGSEYFICDNYLFLENILTAPHPSVKIINSEGKPEFLKESRDYDLINAIDIIHDAVMDYTAIFMNICSFDRGIEIDKELVDLILGSFTRPYTIDESELSKLGFLVDEFCNRSFDSYEVL